MARVRRTETPPSKKLVLAGRDFHTGSQVRIGVLRIVPIDVELVVVPVAVRHVATAVARAVYCRAPSIALKIVCTVFCVARPGRHCFEPKLARVLHAVSFGKPILRLGRAGCISRMFIIENDRVHCTRPEVNKDQAPSVRKPPHGLAGADWRPADSTNRR